MRRTRSRSGGASVLPSETRTIPASGLPAVRRSTSSIAGAIFVPQPSGAVVTTGDPIGGSSAEAEPSRSKTPSPNPEPHDPDGRHPDSTMPDLRCRGSTGDPPREFFRSTGVAEPSRTCMLRLRSTSTATQSGSTSSRGQFGHRPGDTRPRAG